MHRSPASFASKSTGRASRHRGAAAFLSDPATTTAPMAHATAPLPPGASMVQGPVPCVPAVVRVGAKIGGHAVVPRVGGQDGLAGAPAAAGSVGSPSAPTTAASMAVSDELQAFIQASEAAPVAPPVKTREVPPPLAPKVEQLQAIARKCTLAPAHGPLADAPPAAVAKDGAALPRYVVNPFSGRNTLAIAPAVQALRRLGFRSAGRHSPHLVHDGSLAGLVAAASVSGAVKSVNGVAVVEGESLRTRLAAVVAAAGAEAQVQQQHSILAEALRPIPEFVQRAIPAALRQTVKSPAEDPCLAGLDHDTKVYVQAVSKAVAFVSRASTAKHAELLDSFGMPPVPTPAEVALRVAQWQGSPQPADGIQGAAPEVLVNPRQSLTPEQRSVLALITSGRSVYIGGSAGTGKSALLRMVAATLAHERGLNVALTATTGVAALTIGGTTFHRVFRPTSDMGSFSAAALRYFDAVVLDEVSMLGAEALTNFDLSARAARGVDAPFGGLQMITCGDFLQLHIDAATGQPVLRDKARPAASVLEQPPPKKERPSVSRAVARATKAFLAEVKARDLALPLPTKATPKGKDTNARSLDTAEGAGKGKGKDGRGSHVFDSPSFAALVPLRLTATLRHKTDPRFASCLTLLRTGAVARGILERCAKDLDDLPPPMRCPKAHAEAALSLTSSEAATANGATTNSTSTNNNNNAASQPVHAGSRPPVYLFSTRAAAEEHNQRWVGHCDGATHVFEPKYYVMTVGGALEVEGWAEVAVKDPAEQEPPAKPRRRHAPSVAQRREARSGLQAAIAEALGVAPRDITLSPDAALAAAVMYTTATPASRRQNASVTVKCRVGKHHAHGQRKHAGHHASRRFAIADDAVRHLRNALRRSATFLADERTDLSEVVPAAPGAAGDDADATTAANLLGAGAADVQGERTAAADAKGRELLRTRVFRSGCRVMLLYNLSATLVNGSLGTFVGTVSYDPQLLPKGLRRALHPEGNVTHVRGAAKNRRLRLPMVRFDNGEEVVVPHVPVTAPVASPSHELCARAAVVPLGLAYGFTVHKVQGITLDAPVVLDLQQARWKCEHLVYVAASRVRRLQQLNIVNFSRSHVQVNPRVLAFVRQLERASVVCKAMSGLDGKLAATGVDAVAVRDTALPKTTSKAGKAQAAAAGAASEVRAGCTPLQVSLLPAAGLSTWAADAAQDPTGLGLASPSGGGGAPPPAPTAPASPAS